MILTALMSPIGKIAMVVVALIAFKCTYDARLRKEGEEIAVKKINTETKKKLKKKKEEAKVVRKKVSENLKKAKSSSERLDTLNIRR